MSENNQQPNATPADNGGQNEKMFTQEEVNRIVSERLARERSKAEPSPLDEREQAVKAREARLDCREYLKENNYPEALLDALDTSDVSKFKASVEKVAAAYSGRKAVYQGWVPAEHSQRNYTPSEPDAAAAIAGAFKPPKI